MKALTIVIAVVMLVYAGATLVLAKDGLVHVLRQTAASAGALHH